MARFASDQQYWALRFLEAWDLMQTNGYSELQAGPEAGWLGYYSLAKQGRLAGAGLEQLIAEAGEDGLVWTDPEVDPTLCGHRGHFLTSCGLTISHCVQANREGRGCQGDGMGTDFIP